VSVAYNYSSTAGEYTLTSPVSSSATVLQLDSVTGLPPTPFKVVVDPGLTTEEIVKVTNVAGTTLTVVRGHDSSLAVAHSGLAKIRHMLTAEDLRLSRQHEDTATGVHGITSSVVGTSDAQALTNKDLSSPTNTLPSNIATLTGTQALTNKDLTTGNTFPSSLVTLTGTQALGNKDLSAASNVFPTSLATDAELGAHTGAIAAHGVAAAIVGTTDTQTLTNKDLSSSTNIFDTTRWGAVSCTSAGRPSTGNYTGRLAYETDTSRLIRFDGTNWVYVTSLVGAWTAYSPGVTGVGITSSTGKYRTIDGRVDFEAYVVVSGAPTGSVSIGLPGNSGSYSTGLYHIATGISKDVSAGVYNSTWGVFQPNTPSAFSAVELMVPASGTNTALDFVSATTPIPWASGDTISIKGSYNL
jgi:hypothetical protein